MYKEYMSIFEHYKSKEATRYMLREQENGDKRGGE